MRSDNLYYPIKILSFYSDEDNNFLIKYQYRNKRVADTINLDDFMNSPLIYGTHPTQMYYLGYDTSNFLHAMTPPSGRTPDSKGKKSRFKRFFIHG